MPIDFNALLKAQHLGEQLALDIAQRQGLGNWWESISPDVKEGIKREWRRLIYKEIVKGEIDYKEITKGEIIDLSKCQTSSR